MAHLGGRPFAHSGHGATAHSKPDAVAFAPSTDVDAVPKFAAPTQEAVPLVIRALTKPSKLMTEPDAFGEGTLTA